MRKQLLAFNLKQRNILISDVNDKQFSGKIQLSMRQKELEKEIDGEKKATLELERRILSKSSDLLFDSKLHSFYFTFDFIKNFYFCH